MKRTMKKLQLPQDFAQNLLDLEIQYKLSDRPSKQTVKSLIQLYSLGVEYFQSVRSHKYLYFQLKMNDIFTSASTLQAISTQVPLECDSPVKKKMKSNVEQQKIQAYRIKHKQQKMFHQVMENTTNQATVSTVKKIINDSDLKKQAQQQRVRQQLDNQDCKLKDKIQKRRSRLLFSKSFTNADFTGETETRDSLFPDIGITQQGLAIKPIEVSFSSIINQNDSDQQADEIKRRKMSIISNGQGKKSKSELQLYRKKVERNQ